MGVKMEWATYGGGTTALPGKNSYDTKGWYGEFHVWPPSRDLESGRLSPDYKLKWANTTGMPAPHGGLWHDLGKYRSPASAQKAAREYAERNFAGHEGAGTAALAARRGAGGAKAKASRPAGRPKALPSVPEVVVQLKVLRADARDLRRDSDDREPFRLDVELKERASIRRELAAGEMPVGDGRWVVVGGHAGSPSVYSNDKNADLESVARKLVAAHAGR